MPSSGNSESYGNSVFHFFKETPYKFSIVTVPTYIPTNIVVGVFPFLHTLSSIFHL